MRGCRFFWHLSCCWSGNRLGAGLRPSSTGPGTQCVLRAVRAERRRHWNDQEPRVPSSRLSLDVIVSPSVLSFSALGETLPGVCNSEPHVVTFLRFQVHLKLGKYSSSGAIWPESVSSSSLSKAESRQTSLGEHNRRHHKLF